MLPAQYEVVFANNLADVDAMELMDIVTKRAREQGISTQELVRRWMCGDNLQRTDTSPAETCFDYGEVGG